MYLFPFDKRQKREVFCSHVHKKKLAPWELAPKGLLALLAGICRRSPVLNLLGSQYLMSNKEYFCQPDAVVVHGDDFLVLIGELSGLISA